MSLHEDRLKAITYNGPDAIPVSLGILPAAWMKYRERLDALADRYPELFAGHKRPGRDYDAAAGTYAAGDHPDPWGYVWHNIRPGMEAFVTGHPVPTRAGVRDLEAPAVDAGFPHGFMFLRLTYLRGFEEAMVDFAEEPPELGMLIRTVLDYNLRQARIRLGRLGPPPAIVTFGDDLGLQDRLPISPAKWRRWLKPCYTAIYDPFRKAGHFVYMHTDGHILPIVSDLIDCGVNVVNPQVGANGLEGLARTCRGRICVDLDLDRQKFPFWSARDIDAHVLEAVETLGSPDGGLWLKAELNHDIPFENIEAICSSLDRHRFHFG